MERILNITVDNISTMESWEKEALFKTLLNDTNIEFKVADLIVRLYTDSKIYKGNVPEEHINRYFNKFHRV